MEAVLCSVEFSGSWGKAIYFNPDQLNEWGCSQIEISDLGVLPFPPRGQRPVEYVLLDIRERTENNMVVIASKGVDYNGNETEIPVFKRKGGWLTRQYEILWQSDCHFD